MDWSGPTYSESRASGCRFQLGGSFVPRGANKHYSQAHALLYPLEGSALYVYNAEGPTKQRYLFRHFILGYPNGCIVVGWYHNRVLDMSPSEMNTNDVEILSKDTRINWHKAALHAKTMEGDFIRGTVWLGAFNPHHLVHLGPQWHETPSFVLHGFGWNVPSWAFEPEKRVGVPHWKPHALPADYEVCTPKKRQYLPIQPGPGKISEEKSTGALQSVATEVRELWKKASANRLEHSEDQEESRMPTYYDYSALRKE